jgi:hypothetical protein
LSPTILNINSQSFWNQKAEPVEGLWIETSLGEGVLPVWNTKVHDHEPEVIREGITDIKPMA